MDIHFGFSYVGFIYLLLLFIPNIIWIKYKPKDYESYVKNEKKILVIFERVGEVSVSCISIMFSDFNINTIQYWSILLLCSFLIMILYELYWVRYFKSKKEMVDFYKPFLRIPVPGALLPVISFFLLGIYGKNLFLILATIVLGIGHIGIHLSYYKNLKNSF